MLAKPGQVRRLSLTQDKKETHEMEQAAANWRWGEGQTKEGVVHKQE